MTIDTENATVPVEPPHWTPPGKKLAFYRGLVTPHMSQAKLGALVGKTQGWVSQVEKGIIPLDRITILDKLAAAVGVSRYHLTGEPAPPRNKGEMDATISVQAIRTALLIPDDPTQPRDLVRLWDMADQAMRARMHVDHRSLGALLPVLLADARTLCDTPATRVDGLRLLVQSGVTGALAVKPLGHVELAFLLAERAEQAAKELDDPVYVAASQFTMAQCVMALGNANRQSLTIASRAADQVAASGRGPDAAAWRTMLLLHAGLSAGFLHDDDLSRTYMTAAAGTVREVEGDPWRMEANDSNRRLWELSAAANNGHPERADDLFRRIDLTQLHTPQRLGRAHLDYATALARLEQPNYEAATIQLLEAERVAPEDIHRRASVKEMVRDMVRQTRGRAGGVGWVGGPPAGLQELAVRVGIGPEETL